VSVSLHCGDSVEVMRTLADASVDSIVVDPPYGLSDHSHKDVVACLAAWLAGKEFKPKKKGFMGRAWDAWVPGPEVFREALRVAKPGAHMLVFAGTRSMDLMMMAVRLAGWEIRDSIGHAHDGGDPTQAGLMAWTYGSGFPKNMDVSKAIDKAAGVSRTTAGEGARNEHASGNFGMKDRCGDCGKRFFDHDHCTCPKPEAVTPEAQKWDGWGTALKPAWEPIIIARKPLAGTVAANVLNYGTGAYNIDACRIGDEDTRRESYRMTSKGLGGQGYGTGEQDYTRDGSLSGSDAGRWPANVIHDGSDAVLAAFPEAPGARGDVTGDEPSEVTANVLNARARVPYTRGRRPGGFGNVGAEKGDSSPNGPMYEDSGSAARFFYCAKASSADRHEGLKHPGDQFRMGATLREAEQVARAGKGNNHPTVKPTELMRYLVRLVTPPGGTVLDFCMGSGSTGKAAEIEGFSFIGIDADPHWVEVARKRIGGDMPLFQDAA
jgi:DNA modification methylase